MAMKISRSRSHGSIIRPTLGFGMAICVGVNPRSIVIASGNVVEAIGSTHVSAKEGAADAIRIDALKDQ